MSAPRPDTGRLRAKPTAAPAAPAHRPSRLEPTRPPCPRPGPVATIVPTPPATPQTHPRQVRDELRELRALTTEFGMSMPQIALGFGISTATTDRWPHGEDAISPQTGARIENHTHGGARPTHTPRLTTASTRDAITRWVEDVAAVAAPGRVESGAARGTGLGGDDLAADGGAP